MNVEWIPIGKVKENKRNPRKITEDALAKLVESIKEDPEMLEIRPLAIDEKGVVLGGNMRLKALKVLKYEKVPVIRIPGKWSDDKKKRFVIKDNVDLGSWDLEMLSDDYEMAELMKWGLDAEDLDDEDTGADEEEFQASLNVLEIDPPEYPTLKERVQVKIEPFSDYEKVRDAIAKDPDAAGKIKKAFGL